MATEAQKRWRCSVCGYEHDGPEPPENCPLCGAPREEFERVEDAEAEPEVAVPAPAAEKDQLVWHHVAAPDAVPEGGVAKVVAAGRAFALTHYGGAHAALHHSCPHQGGPLGEGVIEDGFLRCPWHGMAFHPTTGESPDGGGGAQTFPCGLRSDGVYVGLPPSEPEQRTVSDVMVETMANWGVTHVFGMVGHSNLGLADAIRRRVETGRLHYIGVRHEGAASFAASAFAKLTGTPAACLSIAGPGATNLLTGLWDARMDRVPILALTGQVDTQVLGPGAFQEVDLTSAFQSVAAWSQAVLPSSRHAELMTLALKHAILKRDVGHLIFPNEVQSLPVAADALPSGPEGRLTPRDITPPQGSVDQALGLLRSANRPAIIVGHGARFRMGPIIKLARTLNCPVITTLSRANRRSSLPGCARCATFRLLSVSMV